MGWSPMLEVPDVFEGMSDRGNTMERGQYMDVMNFIASLFLSLTQAEDQSSGRSSMESRCRMNDNCYMVSMKFMAGEGSAYCHVHWQSSGEERNHLDH